MCRVCEQCSVVIVAEESSCQFLEDCAVLVDCWWYAAESWIGTKPKLGEIDA